MYTGPKGTYKELLWLFSLLFQFFSVTSQLAREDEKWVRRAANKHTHWSCSVCKLHWHGLWENNYPQALWWSVCGVPCANIRGCLQPVSESCRALRPGNEHAGCKWSDCDSNRDEAAATRLKQRQRGKSQRCYRGLKMSSYISNFILFSVRPTPFCTHTHTQTHTYIFEALISHNSDVLLFSTPHLFSFTEVWSQSGSGEWQAIFPQPSPAVLEVCECVCVLQTACVKCECEVPRMRVSCRWWLHWGLSRLFPPSWVPDLPALIGFHRGSAAHRAAATHFILGLH